ncbi:MAG: DUF6089 family protein [Bacteroidales bacterium]|jgi:hypothetical protein|nr:DUF6089 family protein [Bacteroidales bacterium]
MHTNLKIGWTVLALCCSFSLTAQKKRNSIVELHVGAGASYLAGDVGGGFDRFQLSQVRPVLYLGGRYDINEYFSGKANIFMGRMSGNDAGTENDVRGYSFDTPIYELSAQMEWNFLNIPAALGSIASRRRGIMSSGFRTRPYIYAGIGFVYAEPVLEHSGNNLLPGQLTQSRTSGFILPAGIGIKTDLSRQWALGLEIGGRICTSDYLDGLYKEGAKNDDLYFFASLHAIYKIRFLNGKIEKKR